MFDLSTYVPTTTTTISSALVDCQQQPQQERLLQFVAFRRHVPDRCGVYCRDP